MPVPDPVTMDPQAMIAACRQSRQEIKFLETKQQQTDDTVAERMNRIRIKYLMKRTKLEKQEETEKSKIQNEVNAARVSTEIMVSNLSEPIIRLDRIIYFLRAHQETLECGSLDEVNKYKGAHCETVETYKDDCMELRLFIAENDKPKNKYSVVVAGVSKLGSIECNDNILHLPHEYGVTMHVWGLNVVHGAKDVPTIEDARKYAKTRGIKKILKAFFEKYDAAHQEYEETCQQYNLEDFSEIIKERET